MKKSVPVHLQRSLKLLEMAQNRGRGVQIRWRSADLGDWDSVRPRWTLAGGRLRVHFIAWGQLRSYWASSVRQHPWGVQLSLSNSGNPVNENLEIVWQEEERPALDSCGLLDIVRNWLASRFPGCRIVKAERRSDLRRTLSSSFLRVLFRNGGKDGVMIAAGRDSGQEIPRAAGQALLWFSALASDRVLRGNPALYILVPSGNSAVLFHRCRFLNRHRIKTEVWEYGDGDPRQLEWRRAPAPPPPVEDRDFQWPLLGPFRWSSQLERILDLAPHSIRRYPRFRDYDSLRLWGLEFARVSGPERDRVFFGVGNPRVELTDRNFEDFRSLVDEILCFRRPDCPDPRHPYYRLQPERWLESLMLDAIPRLFSEIMPESVYSQIPVYLGENSGRIDILGADCLGTLVVMELKVVPDPDLPLQALDYWGRVVQHNECGDFERRGYFPGIRLSRRRPRIYLVSPVFAFHTTTEELVRYLDPGIEIWKISINEDWRRGVKIIRRVQFKENSGRPFNPQTRSAPRLRMS